MALQRGFRRAPGGGHGRGPERFIPPADYHGPAAPDGTVSRRQYRNAVATGAGFSSQSAYESLSRTPRFRRLAEILADERGSKPNAVRGPGGEFTKQFREVDFSDREAGGSLAQFLEWLGIREPNAAYPVGGSPKAGR
jgi:hypothetical protein